MRVCVQNLGKYNEGELVFKWVDLPCNIDEVLEEIGINEEYEEYHIPDYEGDFTVSEFSDLEELNDFAERVENLSETDVMLVRFLVEDMGLSEDEAIEDVEGGQVWVAYEDADDLYEIGYNEFKNHGEYITEHLETYFDFEKYAEDLLLVSHCYHVYENYVIFWD